MQRKKRTDNPVAQEQAQQRVVALYIKSTNINNAKGGEVKNGDKLSQIACLEFVDGIRTRRQLCSYIKITDNIVEENCINAYRRAKELSDDDKTSMCEKQLAAPAFADIQKELMEFIMAENTLVVVHFKKRVLDFLRANLDEENCKLLNERHKQLMHDVQVSGKQSYKVGLYHGGQYPAQLTNNNDKLNPIDKPRYGFDAWCEENGVKTRRQHHFDAEYDADRMGRAFINERNKLAEAAKKEERQPAASKRKY